MKEEAFLRFFSFSWRRLAASLRRRVRPSSSGNDSLEPPVQPACRRATALGRITQQNLSQRRSPKPSEQGSEPTLERLACGGGDWRILALFSLISPTPHHFVVSVKISVYSVVFSSSLRVINHFVVNSVINVR